MNPFYRRMANNKLNQITPEELYQLAIKYHYPLTKKQAIKVIRILRSEKIDVGDLQQRKRILDRIGKEVSPLIKKTIEDLLKQYNV